VTTFAVDAKFLQPFDISASSQFQTHSEKDDKTRKVQILVFGTGDDVLQIMNKISDKLPSNDTVPSQGSWISGVRMLVNSSVLFQFCT
jgi:hypothetical protein